MAQRAPVCAGPDPYPRTPRLRPPVAACDAHFHICGPKSAYDYNPDRIYTPPDTLLPDYLRVARTLGLERLVFVQPSVYGTDNRCMLDAMAECPLPCRGVAVLASTVSDETLASLHEAGVRGVRFNVVDVTDPSSALPLDAIRRLADRIARFGWHVELLMHVDEYSNLDTLLGHFPVDVVVGHLGYFRPGQDPGHAGFQSLLRLLGRSRCWVKLTGPYRISAQGFPYPDTSRFARILTDTAPDRLVWGTDWPHVMVKKGMPNDGDLLDLLFDWVPDAGICRKILVDNPAVLYGF